MKIALDVGHGLGNKSPGVYDPGAVANKLKETIIVHGMVGRLKANLVKLGHTVLVTEGALGSRDDTAKKWGVNLFVSLHCNAGGGTGVEVFVDTRASSMAKKTAGEITTRLSKELGLTNRGVKVKNFAVLQANPNDLLVEMFFIDSSKDVKAYQADVNGAELALLNGILAGIGAKTVTTLPRLVAPQTPTKPVVMYKEVKIHTSALEAKDYEMFAATHGDFILVKDTTKDSWKTWK
jgi:N-acetylmuramoyl-L-alanine amidase